MGAISYHNSKLWGDYSDLRAKIHLLLDRDIDRGFTLFFDREKDELVFNLYEYACVKTKITQRFCIEIFLESPDQVYDIIRLIVLFR
jgi:hypothetical protein